VGQLDDDNYLTITGRIKELYKTSKGEYVAPTQIEIGFATNPNIEQVCVVGENLPQSMALVVLSDPGRTLSGTELAANLESNLSALNTTLKSYEKLNKIIVMKEPWTVENNKLTPTFKIKRGVIEKEFAGQFEHWYNEPGKVIFE
jgi:long-chain acyl-CoA synthetase